MLRTCTRTCIRAAVAAVSGIGVAACALAYDFAGRGAWIGPALLAACRAGNLAFGILLPTWIAGRSAGDNAAWLGLALLYGGYVFFVSRLARLEDDEDPRPLGTRPARALTLATICLCLVPSVGVFAAAVDAHASRAPAATAAATVAPGTQKSEAIHVTSLVSPFRTGRPSSPPGPTTFSHLGSEERTAK